MTSKEIRKTFLDFFASKGHTIVPSAPVVVKGDPTLMFTNAGMNQFKDWFLGVREPKHNRVADSQKCLRVSGKHNDLEEVGHDTYHHTLFEMLGNWSFGDYFKKEAISWAWELLTDVYGLDKKRLYATVFEGYEADGQPMDTEARDIWLQYLPADHIILGNKHDNFWEMGDTGPCGPCSEIHIDLRSDAEREKVNGAELVNKDNPLVIEIWNLVFMQFNRKANGQLELLPKKHVDTGMGFERLCMALQAKQSNYDTDVFTGMINAISRLSGKPYEPKSQEGIAMRVIADHIRAISFSIADGQLPSNVKAGYVIRRILRRAVRYGYTFLDFKQPFLCRLVNQLVADMGEAFPEIKAQQPLIEKVIREEEEAFLRTLDKGISLINEVMEQAKDTKQISGKAAFTLYDTYGFPIDLSELIAKENGYTIDMKAFEVELQAQKDRARNATAIEEGDWVEVAPYTRCEFIGYDKPWGTIHITKYRTVKAKNKEMFQLVFDRTPFYAESGGQVGDSGVIVSEEGDETIKIINTVKENGLPIHIAERIPSVPTAKFHATIDIERRKATTSNHSATHLLQFALREIVGTHIEQKGSFVCPDYLRFDFSHYEKIDADTLLKVERRVNELIRENSVKDERRGVPVDEARKLGAMALFGEKYGDKVRVIRFGNSVELCGGTHVDATGCIGYFRIIAESAVAAGVRRIEAVTGEKACELAQSNLNDLTAIRSLFNNTPNPIPSIQKLIEENEYMRVEMAELERKKMNEIKEKIIANAKEINGRKVIVAPIDVYDSDAVRNMAFLIHNETTNTVFAAAYKTKDEKACLILMYTDDLVAAGANAAADVKDAARLIQGGGGGQKFLATAGGKDVNNLKAALDKLVEIATR